jgi:hypothetical protein
MIAADDQLILLLARRLLAPRVQEQAPALLRKPLDWDNGSREQGKIRTQGAKGKEQGAKSREQRARSRGQRAGSKGLRAKGMGARRGGKGGKSNGQGVKAATLAF